MQYFRPHGTYKTVPSLFNASQGEAERLEKAIARNLATNGMSVQLINTHFSPIAVEFHYGFESNDWAKNNLKKLLNNQSTFEAILGRRINITTKPNEQGFFIVVPHINRPVIPLGNLLEHPNYINYSPNTPTKAVIGMDTEAQPVVVDVANASGPHMLISGTTGSGKTVLMHTLINSILANALPTETRFVFIDTKRVELVKYMGLKPFLYSPEALGFSTNEAVSILFDMVRLLYVRQRKFNNYKAVNIQQYNQQVEDNQKLPYVIVVIDELADLISSNKKEVCQHLLKILQLGRAFGIHVICATQRPSADIVPTSLRVNFPMRIGLRLPDRHSSRIAIDNPGCELLQGKGDGLYLSDGTYKRFQTAMVTDEEIQNTVEFISKQFK